MPHSTVTIKSFSVAWQIVFYFANMSATTHKEIYIFTENFVLLETKRT